MQTTGPSTDLASIQDKIVSKRFTEALGDLDAVLQSDPDDADALYMQAVCCRYLRQFDRALQVLDQLKTLAPDHSRAHQEEGHTHRDAGRPDDALRCYARACALNPALEASWRGQLDILQQKGQDHRAVWARAQLERLQATPKPLVGVMDLIAQGRLLKAEDICRQFLQKVPHHVEGMRLLADIGKRLGVLDDAEFLLENAVKLAPDDIPLRIDYIHVLRKRQKFQDALAQAKLLLELAFAALFALTALMAVWAFVMSRGRNIIEWQPALPENALKLLCAFVLLLNAGVLLGHHPDDAGVRAHEPEPLRPGTPRWPCPRPAR